MPRNRLQKRSFDIHRDDATNRSKLCPTRPSWDCMAPRGALWRFSMCRTVEKPGQADVLRLGTSNADDTVTSRSQSALRTSKTR